MTTYVRETARANQAVVLARSAAGLTCAAIAAELGISVRSVERHRAALGITAPAPPPLSEEEHRRIRVFLDDGCSLSEIARTIGRDVGTIHHYYKGHSRFEPLDHGQRRLMARLGLSLT